ncbi:MAG: Rpn family recombination-promoting nuclease/putative transposase [Myxococcota bacterium]
MQRHTSTTPRRCSKANSKSPRIIYRRDALFKAVATQPQVYRQIMSKYLPSKLISKLDCAKAYLVNTSTVDGHLRERIADIAVAVPFTHRKATCLVCIEQQTKGAFLPLRALDYQARFMKSIRQEKGELHPVTVHTIVLFSHRMPDTQATGVFDGLDPDDTALAQQSLGTICPVELGKIPPQQLCDGTMCGALELLLRHRRGTQMLPTLQQLVPHLQQIKQQSGGADCVEAIVHYCLCAALESERQNMLQLIKRLGGQEKEVAMTIRTALKREGMQEGLQKGLQKGLQEGMQEGMQKGLKKGMQEGLQKGLEKGRQKLEEAAIRLLGTGMQATEVVQITELPEQRIAQLLDQLKCATTRKIR